MATAELLERARIVRHDEDRRALLGELEEQSQQSVGTLGVQGCGGLVEEPDLRTQRHRPGHRDPQLLAPGELPGILAEELSVKPGAADELSRGRLREVPPGESWPGPDVVQHGPGKHRRRLGDQRDAPASLMGDERPHVGAVEDHLPGIRLGELPEDPEQGRLPPSGRPAERGDGAGLEPEVDSVEQDPVLVGLPQSTGFEQGGHARSRVGRTKASHAQRPEAWDHRPPMERLDALLAAVVPADDKERADLALMQAQRALLPEPLSRSQPAAHFTGSAVVTDGRRVALVHHRRLGRWLQPGGHVEAADGDDLLATALREAAEETGCPVVPHPTAPRPLDVDVHPIPSRGTEPAHLHLDVRFLVLTERPEALREDPEESSAVRWFELDEAIHRAGTAEMRRLLGKVRAVLGV